jgi:hypothetical protein
MTKSRFVGSIFASKELLEERKVSIINTIETFPKKRKIEHLENIVKSVILPFWVHEDIIELLKSKNVAPKNSEIDNNELFYYLKKDNVIKVFNSLVPTENIDEYINKSAYIYELHFVKFLINIILKLDQQEESTSETENRKVAIEKPVTFPAFENFKKYFQIIPSKETEAIKIFHHLKSKKRIDFNNNDDYIIITANEKQPYVSGLVKYLEKEIIQVVPKKGLYNKIQKCFRWENINGVPSLYENETLKNNRKDAVIGAVCNSIAQDFQDQS